MAKNTPLSEVTINMASAMVIFHLILISVVFDYKSVAGVKLSPKKANQNKKYLLFSFLELLSIFLWAFQEKETSAFKLFTRANLGYQLSW